MSIRTTNDREKDFFFLFREFRVFDRMASNLSAESIVRRSGRGFFEPGEYRRCIHRYELGNDALGYFSSMLDERATLEHNYVNNLRSWSRKWHGELTKSKEYSTNKAVWDQIVSTGEQMADVHQTIASNLRDNIQPKLKQWRKDNYEKSFLNYKKSREIEKEFETIQKPWKKLLDTIEEAKENYQKLTKLLRECEEQRLTMTDEISNEQQKQIVDKFIQVKLDLENAKNKYENLLRDVSVDADARQRYEANMTEVFLRFQAFEKKRLEFFKSIFTDYLKTLQHQNAFIKMLDDYENALKRHNAQVDLDDWYKNYGPAAPSNYPRFEEFQENLS